MGNKTLLDEFAIAALSSGIGLSVAGDDGKIFHFSAQAIAERAYSIADEMYKMHVASNGLTENSFDRAIGEAVRRAETMLPRPTKSATPKPHTPTARKPAYTVVSFCEDHHISKAFLYKLFKDGRGPRVFKVGRRTLISLEAAAEWRVQMESTES